MTLNLAILRARGEELSGIVDNLKQGGLTDSLIADLSRELTRKIDEARLSFGTEKQWNWDRDMPRTTVEEIAAQWAQTNNLQEEKTVSVIKYFATKEVEARVNIEEMIAQNGDGAW